MRTFRLALTFLLLAASSAACASAGEENLETSADHLDTSARTRDVQVLKVYAAPSFSISLGSIYPAVHLDQEECKPEGKSWADIKAHDTEVSGTLSVKLDCTDAFTKKYGFPSMRAVTLQGTRTKKSQEASHGYVEFSNGAGGFWVKTVELVVKQSAIDAASFNGVGFYLNAFRYRYYEAPPAPGPNDGNGYFLFADQVRAQANQYPATTLSTGEKARVIKVMLPSADALGGTSSVPAFYFRPFAEFVNGADKHQRWDSVNSDYFVGFNTEFNREDDVLAR